MNETECRVWALSFRVVGVTMTWNNEGITLRETATLDRYDEWPGAPLPFSHDLMSRAMENWLFYCEVRDMNADRTEAQSA